MRIFAPQFWPLDQEKTSERKAEHIDLAFASQVSQTDSRFLYEPLLSAHVSEKPLTDFTLAGKSFKTPIWISSMTGGAQGAGIINRNLARLAAEKGLGMGLGSCRIILSDHTHLDDFRMRPLCGDQVPLFANLGIAQIEELFETGKQDLIRELIDKTETDGLIIHVNPMQEYLQPEGDRFQHSPLITIKRVLDYLDKPVIVKEVGQGMGPLSLLELMKLPLEAIDFGAHGGTNFAMLELLRADVEALEHYTGLTQTGHSAAEMCRYVNEICNREKDLQCSKFIISGGIKGFLDGFFHMNLLQAPSVYGQASALLKPALESYEKLAQYADYEINGLKIAQSYLHINPKFFS